MPSEDSLTVVSLHLVGQDELRRRWGWFLGLGILLIVLGTVALGSTFLLTVVSVLFFGWLLIFGGVFQAVHAFLSKRWSGFFLDLLTGLLYVAVGFMIVANPSASAIALTLLIAVFLIFGGIFRVVVALAVPYQNRVWLVLHGVINVLLGVAIWWQWPLSGLWVIGLFVGVDMIFNGWALVMLALAAKSLPSGPPASA
ncbi:MAG: HdeD family acid-resistance protein [Isosphaeraceae bacterium]|nr:HdeD family acid-resistance protein [Isosphaeraceae bacterium]